jgi:hypothetical protein
MSQTNFCHTRDNNCSFKDNFREEREIKMRRINNYENHQYNEDEPYRKFTSHGDNFFQQGHIATTKISNNLNEKRKIKKNMRRLNRIIRDKESLIYSRNREIRNKQIENQILKLEIEKLKREREQNPYLGSYCSNIVIIEEDEEEFDMNFFSFSEMPHEEENVVIDIEMEDIDPDNMTYEELLELQDKIGYVSRGFSDREIHSIPKIKFDKSLLNFKLEDKICTVCQYEYKSGQDLRLLACKHSFHTRCVDHWFRREKICPNCKDEVVLAKNN